MTMRDFLTKVGNDLQMREDTEKRRVRDIEAITQRLNNEVECRKTSYLAYEGKIIAMANEVKATCMGHATTVSLKLD